MEASLENKTKHPLIKVFIHCTLMFFVCTAPFLILSKGIYISYGDINTQAIPFWYHIVRSVREGMPAYDWYSDLGMNFWGTYTYFGLTDPFMLIGLIFPQRLLPYGITVITALKFGLCGLCSYIYIRPQVKRETSAYIGAMLYTFSGQQLYSMCFIFTQIFAVFPLLLYSFDKLVKERKSVCFALLLALMGFMNYYFLFGCCVFILIYFAVKVWCKEYIIDKKLFAKIAAETVMGLLLCAVTLLPSYYVIKNNSRAGSTIFGESLLYYKNGGTLTRVFLSAFFPPDPCNTDGIVDSFKLDIASISLFIPLFLAVGMIAVFRKQKSSWQCRLLMVCGVMACVPVLNSMFFAFNRNYYARWFFMPMLIMCAVTGRFTDDIENTDIRSELKLSAAVVIIAVILGLPDIIRNDTLMIILAAAYSAAALTALYRFRYKSRVFGMKKLERLTCVFAVIPFLSVQAYLLIHTDMRHTEKAAALLYNDMEEVNIGDSDFFRVCQDNRELYNSAIISKLPSIDIYHNLVTKNESDFYATLSNEGFLNHDQNASDFAVQTFLSVKYDLYSNTDDISPEEIQMLRYGFGLKDVQGHQVIYENENYIPMGFTYDHYLNINRITSRQESYSTPDGEMTDGIITHDETERRERLLLKGIWLTDEQCMKYMDRLSVLPKEAEEDTSLEAFVRDCDNRRNSAAYEFTPDKNGFTSKIKLEKPNLVFYSVPYDEGWTAYVDGAKTDIEKVFAGLCAVPVDAGDHTIRFDYRVIWLKEGLIVTCISGGALAVYAAACFILAHKMKSDAEKISKM